MNKLEQIQQALKTAQELTKTMRREFGATTVDIHNDGSMYIASSGNGFSYAYKAVTIAAENVPAFVKYCSELMSEATP